MVNAYFFLAGYYHFYRIFYVSSHTHFFFSFFPLRRILHLPPWSSSPFLLASPTLVFPLFLPPPLLSPSLPLGAGWGRPFRWRSTSDAPPRRYSTVPCYCLPPQLLVWCLLWRRREGGKERGSVPPLTVGRLGDLSCGVGERRLSS